MGRDGAFVFDIGQPAQPDDEFRVSTLAGDALTRLLDVAIFQAQPLASVLEHQPASYIACTSAGEFRVCSDFRTISDTIAGFRNCVSTENTRPGLRIRPAEWQSAACAKLRETLIMEAWLGAI